MKVAVTILVFCVAALLALGTVMLYSTSMAQVGAHYLIMQLIWTAIGLLLCVTAASLDYRSLKKLVWPLLVFSVLLLVAVLVTTKIKGARRWFSFGPVRFQPSELAKLALIFALAWYGERFQRRMPEWRRGIVVPGLIIGVVLALIFVEPDRGTTILPRCWLRSWVWVFRFGMIQCGQSEFLAGFIWRKANPALVTRRIKPCLRWALEVGQDWAWAMAARNWGSCLRTTPILFFPLLARSLDWSRLCW